MQARGATRKKTKARGWWGGGMDVERGEEPGLSWWSWFGDCDGVGVVYDGAESCDGDGGCDGFDCDVAEDVGVIAKLVSETGCSV